MNVFQEKIVQKAVTELCSKYHKRLEKAPFGINKSEIFTEIILELYQKYKFDLGFMNNPSGFKSLLVREKNRQKKELREMEAEIIYFLSSEQKESEDCFIIWGNDISNLSVEMQEQLGLNM